MLIDLIAPFVLNYASVCVCARARLIRRPKGDSAAITTGTIYQASKTADDVINNCNRGQASRPIEISFHTELVTGNYLVSAV